MAADSLERLFDGESHTDWTPSDLAQGHDQRLQLGVGFTSVATAQVRHNHPNLLQLEAEHPGQVFPHQEWVLGS
tara:strand:- start:73 stop:294 length:222 start_codon:yes stop_codon:yes gene_type:complete